MDEFNYMTHKEIPMSLSHYSEVLSKREKQIAEKILEGLPKKTIGSDLFISERTVKFHCHNIYRKLDIRSRYALVARHYQDMELV
jgi:DNA-binding NarL/FixJ family response regulator